MEANPDRFLRYDPARRAARRRGRAGALPARRRNGTWFSSRTPRRASTPSCARSNSGPATRSSPPRIPTTRCARRSARSAGAPGRSCGGPNCFAGPECEKHLVRIQSRKNSANEPRLLVLDHIASPTGLIFPVKRLAALARARGVRVLVDGAHAPGQLALDIPSLGVDWYAGNCHKWLFAPKGCGFLWARRERAGGHPPAGHLARLRQGLRRGIRLDRHARLFGLAGGSGRHCISFSELGPASHQSATTTTSSVQKAKEVSHGLEHAARRPAGTARLDDGDPPAGAPAAPRSAAAHGRNG